MYNDPESGGSDSGISAKPNGRTITPQIVPPAPLIVSWNRTNSSSEPDPAPPAQPGFKCRCKRCLKNVVLPPATPPDGEGDLLKLLTICEKLYLNCASEGAYLQIYSGDESSPSNVVVTVQRISGMGGDSSLIFIDPCDRIILKSGRDGKVTTLRMGTITLGTLNGAPGDLCSFQRNFSITMFPKSADVERKWKLKAVGCCTKLCCCSFFNAFYLDEFVIQAFDEEGGVTELGWIRRGEGKNDSPTVHFSPAIRDTVDVKGVILAASVTVYELFLEPHFGYGIGTVGNFYVVVLGLLSTFVGALFCLYQYQEGVWTI